MTTTKTAAGGQRSSRDTVEIWDFQTVFMLPGLPKFTAFQSYQNNFAVVVHDWSE